MFSIMKIIEIVGFKYSLFSLMRRENLVCILGGPYGLAHIEIGNDLY